MLRQRVLCARHANIHDQRRAKHQVSDILAQRELLRAQGAHHRRQQRVRCAVAQRGIGQRLQQDEQAFICILRQQGKAPRFNAFQPLQGADRSAALVEQSAQRFLQIEPAAQQRCARQVIGLDNFTGHARLHDALQCNPLAQQGANHALVASLPGGCIALGHARLVGH